MPDTIDTTSPDYWAQQGSQVLQRDQAEQLRHSLMYALPVNPDTEAQTRRYAAAVQVPMDTARAMPDQIKQQAQLSEFDAQEMLRKFPNTARWLGVPDNMKLAHDDIPATAAVEQSVKALERPAGAAEAPPFSLAGTAKYLFGDSVSGFFSGGAAELAKGLGGAFNHAASAVNLAAGALPVLYDKMAGGTSAGDWWFRNMVDPVKERASVFDADPNAPFVHKALNTAGGLLGTLSQITLSGSGGVAAEAGAGASAAEALGAAAEHGTRAMAFPALSDAVNTGRRVYDETGDPTAAFKAAGAQWLGTSAMGVLPLSAPGGLGTRLTTGAASGAVTGELTRQGLNAAMPDSMATPFDWESTFLSALSGSLLAGAMGPHAEADRLTPTVRDAYREAFQAEATAGKMQTLTELSKAAAASKLRERDPEAFKQFVKQAAEDGDLQGVYVEGTKLAEVLQQAGVSADELRQTMPEVARQMDTALGEEAPHNALVEIPIEDFATHIAGSPVEQGLMKHLRVEPEGGTVGESEAFQQAQVADMEARAGKLATAHEGDQAYQTSLDQVTQDVQQRLQAAGVKPDQAATNAAPLVAFYQVHADQMGLLPHEFAERYPVNFSNQALEGLEQPAREQTAPELIVTHNLTADNLLHAKKMGGIAVPSLAITKKNTPLGGFGGITLIGDANLADPKGYAGTKVFGADIYSPRYPAVEREINPKQRTALEKYTKAWADKLAETMPDTRDLEREGQRELERSAAMMATFLAEKGVEPAIVAKEPTMTPERIARLKSFGITDEMLAKTDSYDLLDDPAFVKAAAAETANTYRTAGGKPLALMADKIERDEAAQRDAARDVAWSIATAARDAKNPTPDKYATQRALEKQIDDANLREAYEAHVRTWLDDITKSERIPQGYTDSGNKKYTPHTLENVVKILKKELRGGESFNYGVGSLRAKFTPEFRSLAAIKKEKGRLVSADQFETLKKEVDAEFNKLGDLMGVANDETLAAILEDAPKMGLERAAADFKVTLTPEAGQAAVDFLNKLRDLPTAYFEAKVLRDVSPAEFKGAVVPDDIKPEALAYLRENIGDIRTYKAGDEADRAAKIGEFEHLFFQRQQAADARGTFSPSTKTISVLKGADLSTFQHELGHYFLDTMSHLAAQPDAPASVKADMQTLLKWFEVPDLESWDRMTLDEQRASHEKFATGWETYLMKGQAPTLELRGLFQRFRSWMISVYKSLKNAPGDFTPEVRGVFDRLIASEDAIAQAEQARKYLPLFDSPDQAGMTPEQWSAYQATGKDATELAIEGLVGKTLKDMAWMGRLRADAIKSVQKEADEKRKALMREVRPEVMAQPVYRAWTFLTGRGESDQRAEQRRGSTSAEIDPSRDSLLTAIAKLGGLDREAARNELGVHPDDHNTPSGVFGKPVFRKEGGLSPDRMAEMLAEHHYLLPDENGRWSVGDLEERIAAELGGKPQYSVAHDYAGDAPDALPNADHVTFGRLRTSDLRDMFGTKEGAAWRRLADMRMTSDKRGISPEIVADMFGFPSGRDLVQALLDAERPRAVIEGITDQRMLERHGELADQAAVARTADALVQNEVRARFVATELKALRDAVTVRTETGKTVQARRPDGTVIRYKQTIDGMLAAAKEAAAKTTDAARVRDLSERQYLAAETRSAGQAERAMMKGDTEGAAVAKRDQLLNMELARAAREAKEYVGKAVDYLAKFDKASVRSGIDLEYRDQIDALLDRYDLRKSVSGKALDKREALLAFVERMAADGYKPQIPERLIDEAQRQHYKDMPLAEFRGLVDAVKSIEHLGKLKTRLRDLQETRAIDELADEMAATAAKMPQRTPDSNRGLSRMQAAWVKTKAFGRSAEAALLKMEQMLDWLDARNPNGVLNRVVFRRLAEAGTHENDLLARVKGDIDALIHAHLADVTKEKGKIYVAEGLIDGATGQPQRFTTKEMLMLAGNMGNESNAAKMANGEKWDQAEVWRFLHQNMTKAHWDYVAGMGRVLESLWPEKLAMDRRLGNTSPEKIQPRPFDTPHGRYEGWYWPLMYDPARSQDVAERGAKQGDALFENIYARANTDTGRMNTRNENYARPLLLDLDALPRMIKDEIHDISHHEAIVDADRFLSHPTVRKAIIGALSQEHYDQLRPWLQSIANDGKVSTDGARGMEFFNKIASEARTRATMVGLGFRLTTAMVHGMSAGAESVAELGGKWFASGLKDFANPGQWAANRDFIFERSGEMRNRMNEVDRDVREHLREIDLHLMDPTTSALARGSDLMKAHAYTMIAGLDMASALPTWMGAYKKGLTPIERGGLGLSEADASYFADKTVRNAHGGTGVKDMARIQRGTEFQKLFTMFYTFWNHNINRITDTARLVTSPEHREAMKEANHWSDTQLASTVIMRTLVYTLGVQVLHSLVHPPKEGADEESWLAWAAKEMTAAAFGGIPIARDLSAHFLTGRDYSVTPAASVVDAVGKSGVDAAHALTGQEVSDKWLKHTVTTAGYVFNLPTGQLGGSAQFLWDVANGKQHPEGVKDWWSGMLHGDTKH